MLPQKSPQRGIRRSAIALFALLVHAPAFGDTPEPEKDKSKDNLEPLIVSALRTPRGASTVTAAVTVLDPEELQNQGLFSLRDALNQVPGVTSISTAGQVGAQANVFIRGTTTKYTQLVVDGMRLSDSNNLLNHALGSSTTNDVGGIEVLHGPQGAIYGGESIGGVIWLETPHGSGNPRGSTTLEGGSFGSFDARSMFQGQSGDLSYYLSGGYGQTNNDAPHNDYHQGSTALRVEGKINDAWTVGTTFRASESWGEDLDTSYSYGGESQLDSALSTVYAIGKISDVWTARFHVGYYQESFDQDYIDTWSGPSTYFSDLKAGSFSTDHEITLAENLRLLAGAFLHKDSYESSYSSDQENTRYGAHATMEWDVIAHLTTTASLRWENYDAYGDELTWRFGTIYTVASTGTTFRGSVGTSFRAPTYMELYGSAYNPPSPNLKAESSLGWDLGIEQKMGEHHVIELTWFQNQITDQIPNPPFSFPAFNVPGTTDTNGLEFALRGNCMNKTIGYRLAWTYLHDSLQKAGLPENAATGSIDWKPTDKSLVGIGAAYLSDHSWGGTALDSQFVARLYGSYQLTEKVKLHARVENVFNENYELYNGYGSVAQGAGTGFYAGITVDW